MSPASQTQASPRPSNNRGGLRRERILNALHDCIIEKGYAKASLADVARAADMSPSHLLYYFRGKDSILEAYFQKVADRIVDRIDGFRGESTQRQIELLSDLFFAGKGITRFEIGFMLECFGVAVHDEKLHNLKAELDRSCKLYLEELFAQSPAGRARARNRAELAYALLIGLRTASFFDDRLDIAQTRQLFHDGMVSLASGRDLGPESGVDHDH